MTPVVVGSNLTGHPKPLTESRGQRTSAEVSRDATVERFPERSEKRSAIASRLTSAS